MPSVMLEPLMNITVLAPDVYMYDISDMIHQLFQYYIQQQHDFVSDRFVSTTWFLFQKINNIWYK